MLADNSATEGTPYRAVLFRTTDAGRGFVEVTAPSARSRTGAALPVLGLTFVDPSQGFAVLGDPDVRRPTALLSTNDAGRSWNRVRLPGAARDHTLSLAGHGDRVFAVTIHCRTHRECATVRLYVSRTGSNTWHRVAAALPARQSDSGVGLAAWGSTVWLMLGVGSSMHPLTLLSRDGGSTFASIPATNAASCSPVATSTRVIWTTCSTGMLLAFQHTEGRAPPRRLKVFGAGTTATFLAPLSDQQAYFGTTAGRYAGLYLTRDGGATFTKVAELPRTLTREMDTSAATFLTSRVGLAAFHDARLLRTSDGGRTWRPVRLPGAPGQPE